MTSHIPVLVDEVVALATGAARLVDGTVGFGGHTSALLAPGRSVLGIDRDPMALEAARTRLPESVELVEGAFGDEHVLHAVREFAPDFILLDLGVSSVQLDLDGRGFSFRPGAPLDMRMGQGGPTAADWLNDANVEALATAFRDLADERHSYRLARAIGRRRAKEPFETADHLVNAIREVLGARSGPSEFARLFQAVRMVVNDEVGQLSSALPALREALATDGILAVISYHSGEDRIVKHQFRDWARSCVCPPQVPICSCRGRPLGTLLFSKPARPTDAEIQANARARSARLRAFRVA